MASIADLFVNVGADISDFKRQMADMQKTLKNAGDKMKDIGGTMSKTITAPLAGVGVAAFASANEFDKAIKTIRAGTGATGDALNELNDSFKNVFERVPEDAATVSSALADINTRTGLTGKPLEKMTEQFLELSRVTGQDVSSSISEVTRLFGDWGVAAEDSGAAMDYLWKVSQTTGIGVDQLSQKLVQYGAPLRQLGYSMEESAAIMGKWEKEGVNMELVMGGMRQALGKMAQDAKEPTKEFPRLIEQIQSAGTAGEANAIALEAFGARAGADMAAAIREGRFEIDDLMATLGNSNETIGQAADDTIGLSEQFGMLKNNAMTAIEPVGKIMVDLAQTYLPPLISGVKSVAEWFAALSPTMQKIILIVGAIVAAIGPMLVIAGFLVNSISALIPLFTSVGAAIAGATIPIWPIIAAVGALIAIGVLLYKNWDFVKEKAIEAWGAIMEFIKPAVAAIKAFVMDKFNEVKAWWLELWPTLSQAFTNIWNGIKAVATVVINAIVAVFKWAWPFIEMLIVTVWENIKGVINGALNIIMGIIEAFANLFTGNWQGLWDSVKKIISGALELIWNWVQIFGIGKLLKFFTGLVGKIMSPIMQLFSKMKGAFKNGLNAISNGVTTRFNNILSFINGLKQTFYNAGKGLIDMMKNGITNAAKAVVNKVKDIAGSIRDMLPFSPAKEGPLSDLDRLDFGGPIGDSIERALPKVQSMMNNLLQLPDVESNSAYMGSGNTPVALYLDGREIARGTLPHMEREIRLKTGLRM